MAGLPRGYEARTTSPGDLEAVAAVLVAHDLADIGEAYLDALYLRETWSSPRLDLGSDTWVVIAPGHSIVGYGQSVREEPGIVESWGVVHPEHGGLGIGSFLLDRIEDRAGAHLAGISSARVRHSTISTDRAAAAMLTTRGFRPVRHFWHMRIDLDEQKLAGEPPAAIQIRGVDPGRDLAAVHGVLSEAFSEDDWRRPARLLSEWTAEQIASPSYDPTLWLLAIEGRAPVGALTAGDQGGRGWVNELGVRRGYRGRGIGAALLRASFAEFSMRGLQQVMLSVDAENPTGATVLYERVGMRVVRAWDLWEKDAGVRF